MKHPRIVLLAGLLSIVSWQALAAPKGPSASVQIIAKPSATPLKATPCGQPMLDAAHRLILLPFESQLKNQDPAIGESAADTLQLSLLKPENRRFRVISRKHVKSILAELTFSESALSDPKKALKLGQLLSANLMLTGTVTGGKIHTSEVTNKQQVEYTWATVQVNTTLIDIETGEVLFAGKSEGSSARYPTWQGDTYTSIIVEAVQAASNRLASELIAAQDAALRRPGA